MSSDAEILSPRARAGDAGPRPDTRRWAALVVMLLAAFMNLLDVSIVNIAIPSIQRGLHATYAGVQWALAGYALSYALVLITGGRLGDAYGRKRLFLIGVIGFTIMSALCGAAQSTGMLITSRVGQGAMGALMIPQVLSVIQVMFPAAERIKTRRNGSPLVELRMFRQRGFAVGMAIALVFFLGVASFGLVLTLFLQEGLGDTPLHAGATFVPFSLGLFIASGAAARRSRTSSPPRSPTRCGSRWACSCSPSCSCWRCRPDVVTGPGRSPSESTAVTSTRGLSP